MKCGLAGAVTPQQRILLGLAGAELPHETTPGGVAEAVTIACAATAGYGPPATWGVAACHSGEVVMWSRRVLAGLLSILCGIGMIVVFAPPAAASTTTAVA